MIKEQAIIVNKPNQIKKTMRTWKQKSTKRKKKQQKSVPSQPNTEYQNWREKKKQPKSI